MKTTYQDAFQNPNSRHESSYTNPSGRSYEGSGQRPQYTNDSTQMISLPRSDERAKVHEPYARQKYELDAPGRHLSGARLQVANDKSAKASRFDKESSLMEESSRNVATSQILLQGSYDSVQSQQTDYLKTQAFPEMKQYLSDGQEQIRATIYGHCIGDAIGLLTEFMSRKDVIKHYGYGDRLELKDKINDSHRKRWKIGDWTDDSDQMILIMQSLTALNGKVSQEDFASKLSKWSVEGFRELGDSCGVGIGRSTYSVLQHPAFKTEPLEAADSVWTRSYQSLAPNGGVMRTAILGIHEFWDLQKVTANAIDICRTTHADPRCLASAVAVCVAIALMLQRKHPYYNRRLNKYYTGAIIQRCYEFACELLLDEQYKTELSRALFCSDLDSLQLDDPTKLGYTFKCLAAGFWALKQDDFRQALTEIVKRGGDADTNGAVAGALLGCKLGKINSLPSSWLDGLTHKVWLNDQIYRYLGVLRGMYKGFIQSPQAQAGGFE